MGIKVLLVDDDEALLTLFGTELNNNGFETVIASDGKTAMEKAKSEHPEFILLDQVLPDIQGNDILKMLKCDEETKHIPIAMLSNFGQEELIEEAINMGALEYILKYRIEPHDLVAKIKQLMEESKIQN